MSVNKKHDWLVDKLFDRPEIIGINSRDIIGKMREYRLMDRGRIITEPDLVLIKHNLTYMVEVKSGHSPVLYDKGMNQLEKIVKWHKKNEIMVPDVSLVLPARDDYKRWYDSVNDLQVYKLGDTYK